MIRILFLVLLFFSSCQEQTDKKGGWQKVYQNDENGKATFGDKSELIDAVRLGYPIRLGWGSNRVEHVADADFLTIFEGEEVFAQIKTIIGQAPKIDGDSLKIRFRAQNNWTKIAGTNGYFTAVMTDYFQDTLVGGNTDRYAPSTWFVLYPDHNKKIEARPFWRDGSPNWKKWDKSMN